MKFIASLSLLSLLVLSSGCSVSPLQYVENGNKAADAGRYDEAQIDYEKAIQKDQNLGEAYYRLGKLQLRLAHSTDAHRNLSTAAQLLPGREDVAVALADACLSGYLQNHQASVYYDQLSSMTAKLLKDNPQSYDGLRLTGYIRMIDRNYPEAVDFLRKADAVKPMQQDAVHALVQCLIQNGQGPEAETVANSLIREKKTFAPIYDTLYGYYLRNNRTADAEALLKTKVANNTGSIEYRLQLAAHYTRTQNEAALNGVIQELRDNQKFPDARLEIGNFYLNVNRPDQALREFQAGAAESPKRKTDYQKRVAEVLLAQGKRDEAATVIDEILKDRPADFDARLMRAGINVDSGDQSRLSAGLAELETLSKERPTDPITRFNLGKARLRNGDANGALTDFKEALRMDPQLLQARVLAANTSLQTEDYSGAEHYADEILQVANDNPAARLLKAQSLAGQGNYVEATAEASRLSRDFPAAVEPKLELAALALAQKRYGEAEAMYRAVYAADGKNIRALEGVAAVFFAQNRPDSAIQFLSAEAAKGNSPQVRIVLADSALRAQKYDLAIQQYTELVNANPKASFAHLRLGDAYLAKGNTGEAVSQFQSAKTLAPKDALVNSMLALSLHDDGRLPEAQKAYRDALALQSGNPLVMNNLAYLMAETGGNLDEALRLAQDASRRQPANGELSDTVGWIYLKKNLTDSAIQVLSNVVEKNPKQPVYRYHLGAALLQKGDKAGAKRELQLAMANNPPKKDQDKIADLLIKAR